MPTAATIRAVVFDLDDTLYLERDYVRSGYHAVADALRARLAVDEPFEDWLWRRFRAGRAGGAFDALSEQFALDLSADQIRDLVTVYRQHRPDIHADPEVVAVLAALQRRFDLAVLSDGYLPAQRLKLEALQLGRYFQAVVLTEELDRECWKPSEAGFEAVADALGVAHASCVYVGDNPTKDFLAPNRLGWLTVQLLQPGQVYADLDPPPGGRCGVDVALRS
jgi:putative hydrolase of the HAD superfamily